MNIETIKYLIAVCKEHEIKPKMADDGIEYFEVRNDGRGNLLHTPRDGPMIDLITGKRLVF